MAQSISALNAISTLPLTSDRPSTFISKPLRPSILKSPNPKPIKNNVSMAVKGDLDHLQRSSNRRINPSSIVFDRYPTTRTTQQVVTDDDQLSYYRTPWEIKEKETEYKVRFDMPGMTREDVKVWVEEKNMLVVQAEKIPTKNKMASSSDKNDVSNANMTTSSDGENSMEEESDTDWPAKSFGRYRNVIALPENIEIEKIKAEVRDGVLYITIPKASVSAKVLNIAVQ